MGLQERVHLAWISSAEAQKFVQVVTEFTEKIKTLGPNPLSAFSDSPRAAAAGLCGSAFDGAGGRSRNPVPIEARR